MTTAPDKAAQKQRALAAANGNTTVPAGARQPMDHQPAREDVTGPKDTTVHWNGHEYFIEGEALDDLELIELFNKNNYVAALERLLGPEGWEAYKNNSRNEKGRVTLSGAAEFLEQVIAEVRRGNS